MSASPLNLPVDIPWKVIAASMDMEATRFGAGGLPPQWRSSLAIAVYEPSIDDLPTELCGDRISYIKVTCSITGWQATQADGDRLRQAYPQLDIDSLVREYFACYGVLLNVSVFAHTNDQQANDGGAVRIIDMQPKTRDLYQMATETGEVLSGSSSDVSTDKSHSATHDSQWGLSAQASGGYTPAQGAAPGGAPGGGFGFNVLGGLTHSWGESDKDSSSTQIDASRERRERQSTTTNISQMYNLLTGYHTGTNRVVFLLLPRPHILQPTDHRTFIQGLRIIEGIQEFLLIVSRPRDAQVTGLCVEAHLETSHLPEELQVDEKPAEYEEDYEDFYVQKYVGHNSGPGDNVLIDVTQNVLRDGFVIDTRTPVLDQNGQRRPPRLDGRLADDGHPGMQRLESYSLRADGNHDQDVGFWENFYGAVAPGSAKVTALLNSGDADSTLVQRYRILTRAANPKPKITEITASYIMTSRCLAACFTSGDNDCVTPVAVANDFCIPSEWVANEIEITV